MGESVAKTGNMQILAFSFVKSVTLLSIASVRNRNELQPTDIPLFTQSTSVVILGSP